MKIPITITMCDIIKYFSLDLNALIICFVAVTVIYNSIWGR